MAEAEDVRQTEPDFAAYETHQDEIQQEVSAQPLIGAKQPFAALKKQYAKHDVFTQKLDGLDASHAFRRSIRGDGHCFYRSIIFGFLEHFISTDNTAGIEAMKQNATAKNTILTQKLGMPWTLEDFYQAYIDICNLALVCIQSKTEGSDPFNAILNAFEESDGYVIGFLRYMASAEVKTNEIYKFTVPNGDVNEFVRTHIEAVNSEVDSLAVQAVGASIGLPFRIYYLDQSSGPMTSYNFPHDKEPLIHLLYRPGHYDLIYASHLNSLSVLNAFFFSTTSLLKKQ